VKDRQLNLRRQQTFRHHRLLRSGATLTALCSTWSLVLAPSLGAATTRAPQPPGSVRALSPDEMRAIVGTQTTVGPMQAATVDGPAPGAPLPWVAAVGGTDTGNGNKLTSLPLVSWTARGGLPVAFTLSHSSQSLYNGELGQKWTHSYDISLAVAASGGTGGGGGGVGGGGGLGANVVRPRTTTAATANTSSPVAVTWGDGQSYTFSSDGGGGFVAPTGVYDLLVQNIDGTYTITKKDQTQYHFNAALFCDTIRDENGNAVTVSRNAANQVTTVADPTGRTLALAYDASSRVRTVTDPVGRVWTLTYDGSGQLTQVAWPAVSGSTYSMGYGYNSAHDITSITDLAGNVTTRGYNSNDGLVWEKDPALNQTSYAYGSSSATITDPNGGATVYTYDSSGRLSQVKDALLFHEDYQYDASNNKTQVTDKRGNAWAYTYDGMGNVLTAKDPLLDTTACTYSGQNKLLTKTLPGGESTANAYDASDNMTGVQQKDSSGSVKATTSYAYPATSYGLPSSKTDADGHTTGYGYSANGDLVSVTTPLGNRTQWGYNGLGVKTSRTDALGRLTGYTLDGWDRVTTTTYPNTATKTVSYDADANVTGFTDATGTTSRTYDADNRLLSEGKGGAPVVAHSYDATGKLGLLSTTTDANGRVLTYAYTALNQLSTVAEAAGTATYAYDADGNQTGLTNPNGTTVADVYDAANRLTSITNKSGAGAVLSSFGYGYNSDNRRTSVTETNGDVVSYGYDSLLHLSSESRTGASGYTALYAVDGAGDRTSSTVAGVTTTYAYDADDELKSTSGGFVNSYGYNANGDQTARTVGGALFALTYDYDDQLTTAGGSSFAYDAAGRRVSRTSGGVTTNFLFDGGSILLEKRGSATTATYTYGNALIRKDGETPLFDGLGSERTVTNGSGAVTASLTLSAFGQTVASTGSGTSAYQFGATSGYRTEGDAGLTLVGCRFYDAQVGQFITRDTYLDQAPYAYCDGDPINAVDPSGHALNSLQDFLRFLGLDVTVTIKVIVRTGGGTTTVDKEGSDYDGSTTTWPGGGKTTHGHIHRGGVKTTTVKEGTVVEVTIDIKFNKGK